MDVLRRAEKFVVPRQFLYGSGSLKCDRPIICAISLVFRYSYNFAIHRYLPAGIPTGILYRVLGESKVHIFVKF